MLDPNVAIRRFPDVRDNVDKGEGINGDISVSVMQSTSSGWLGSWSTSKSPFWIWDEVR